MKIRSRRTVAFVLFAVPALLTAQVQRDAVPLRHWGAPLYWQTAEIPSLQSAAPAQASASSLVFVGMTPCRIADTRAGQGFTGDFGPPSLPAGGSRTFPVQVSATCAIPSIAQAYSFNVTVVPPGPLGFITMWPTGQSRPLAATLNSLQGFIVGNAAIITAGTGGSVDVFASDATDLIIDINGYYAPQSAVAVTQGSAAAPSLSFSGDPGTGIFSSGAGAVDISSGGSSRLHVRPDGDVDISGNIRKNGILFLHNLGLGGNGNTALGMNALPLSGGSTGSDNVAIGNFALLKNTDGEGNTAVGISSLQRNTSGGSNTAVGLGALLANTTANDSTAVGRGALQGSTTGASNTAIGSGAMNNNTTGADNTVVGFGAMQSNSAGNSNTAIGSEALRNGAAGSNNTALGFKALNINAGGANTAVGFEALLNSTGINNIGIGDGGGVNVAAGNNNIEIGNIGAAGDSNTIRIGTVGTQTAFFAAGIRGVTPAAGAVAVLIDANGQLGTASSSRRFKEDIEDMAQHSSGLLRLRPVTFRYKQAYADGSKPLEFGLIAEEVEEVYPDLVARSADGQVETVQYQKLVPMLLNELQKEHKVVGQLQTQVSQLQEMLKALVFGNSRPADGR